MHYTFMCFGIYVMGVEHRFVNSFIFHWVLAYLLLCVFVGRVRMDGFSFVIY